MKRNTLIAALLVSAIFLIVVLTSAFSFNYSLPFFGSVIVQNAGTTCNDSDGGVFFYSKGAVSMCTGESCIAQAEDSCTSDVLSEYYCSEKNEIKTMNLKCPFGCDDGACMTLGQQPKQQAKTEETPAASAPEKEAKAIVCSEGWTCAAKTKVYQNIDCEWLKEEYCRYGCNEGACTNPSFWKKFLFWLNGQVK